MICITCQKEAKEGKVSKGEFTCKYCIAKAKKEAWELQVADKFKNVSSAVERMGNMYYMVKNDLNELEEFIQEKGIKLTK